MKSVSIPVPSTIGPYRVIRPLAQGGMAAVFEVENPTTRERLALKLLTHRGLATGVRFVTGHCRGDRPLDLNLASLADPDTTLVVYMGLAHLAEISRQLVEHGLPANMPAVAIASGTTAKQKVCRATLGDIVDAVTDMALKPPVLTVIGHTAGLADRWLEQWSQQVPALAGAANDG